MRYEIRKLWSNKVIILGIIVLMLISIYYGYINGDTNAIEYVYKADRIYIGEYTEDKYKSVCERFAVLTPEDDEFFTYLSLYGEVEKCKYIVDYRNSVVKAAKRLKKSSDIYISRTNSRIEEIYNDMPLLEITETTKHGRVIGDIKWQQPQDIVSIMLIIFASSYIFTMEHSQNTYRLVFSSKAGRKKTYIRKLFCIVGLAFVVSATTNICICLMYAVRGDWHIWTLPIQYFDEFKEAPYIVSLLEYVLVTIFIKALGLVVLGICSVVVSLLLKRCIMPVIISSLVMVGSYVMCSFYGNYSLVGETVIQSRYEMYNIFKRYTCIGLINNSGYYTEAYMPVNILNYPVDMVYVNICINLVFVVMTAYLGYRVYRRRDA